MSTPPVEQAPQYSTRLIGRSTEVGELIDLLTIQKKQLITVVGESGIGKTRLCLNVIEQLQLHMPMHFISLAAVQQPELVIPTIAQQLGIHQQGISAHDSIIATLGEDPHVLVIDNLEQVTQAATELVAILEHTACSMLITSQTVLGITAEYAYVVPPLAIPSGEQLDQLDVVAQFPAVALFLDRLHTVQPGFQLTQANVHDVVEICHQARGIPLIIELVAAQSDMLHPADLLAILKQYLALVPYLSLKTTDIPQGREVLLRPVLDWCYSRLDSTLQQLFRGMGAFLGGCTFEDLKSIFADSVLEPRHLGTLVQKNLVLFDARSGSERYEMLDAVRAYATRRLKKGSEGAAIEARHAYYYAGLVAEAHTHMHSPDHGQWAERLTAELPNLRKALQWLLDQEYLFGAAQCMFNLHSFWTTQGHLQEGELWFKRALHHKQLDQLEPSVIAKLHFELGRTLATQGDLLQAQTHYMQSLAMYQAIDDLPGQAHVQNSLGVIAIRQGALQTAEQHFSTVRQLGQLYPEQLSDLTARALTNLAVLVAQQHRWDEAEQITRQALALYREQNNEMYVAAALCNLGEIYLKRHQPAAALEYINESISILRRLNMLVRLVESLNNSGKAFLFQERFQEAYASFHECILTAHRTNNVKGLALGLEWMAAWMAAQHQPHQAVHILGMAQAIRDQTHTPRMITDEDDYAVLCATLEQQIEPQLWHDLFTQGQQTTPKQLIAKLALPR